MELELDYKRANCIQGFNLLNHGNAGSRWSRDNCSRANLPWAMFDRVQRPNNMFSAETKILRGILSLCFFILIVVEQGVRSAPLKVFHTTLPLNAIQD